MDTSRRWSAFQEFSVTWILAFLVVFRQNPVAQTILYELDMGISTSVVNSPEGEFYAIKLKDPGKPPGHIPASFRCLSYARSIEEPYSSRYWPKKKLDLGYPWTEVKRAVWNWNGPITREAFDAAKQKGVPSCPGCAETVHVKVIGGRLWVSTAALASYGLGFFEEIMKVTLYLFDVSDMEFLIFIGDACNPGKPALAYSICRDRPNAGFTMPTTGMWGHSLGPTQMTAYHACLAERYPIEGRKPLAVWRGTTTYQFGINRDNWDKVPRVQLHLLTRQHPDVLDARISRVTSPDPIVRAALNDTGSFVPMEDYNRYCAVLHMDGNGWSDRFLNALIHYPTPVIRVATNRTAAVEHLFAPGDSIETFRPDFSDLLDKVRVQVAQCLRGGPRSPHWRMVSQKQRLARMLMDHVGVAEAMAASLFAYKQLTAFEVDTSLEGFREVNMSCCVHTNLPPRFAEAVSLRLQGQQGR